MMNKKEIFKKVGGIITELNEQYEYLSQSPENLNELELELFAANADFLSDHISILVKLNEGSKVIHADPVAEDKQAEEEHPEAALIHDMEPAEIYEEEEVTIPNWKFELEKDSTDTFEYEEKLEDKLFDRPLTEEELLIIDQKTLLKAGQEEFEIRIEESSEFESEPDEALEEMEIDEVLITGSFQAVPPDPLPEKTKEDNPPLTINDMLSAGTSQNTVSSQFVHRHGKDLKGLISLNDKLLFVRDLFNGYSLAYSEAIELLNRFDSIEAADKFLKQNYSVKNNWADKQTAADKFYEILNTRYAK